MMGYKVKEIFDTLQGEGARAGSRAVFLRMAGCNLWNGRAVDRGKGKGACAKWCDTDFVGGEMLTAEQIVERMDRLWARPDDRSDHVRWVVISGGEPFLQVDKALVDALHAVGWAIAVETNGTVDNPMAAEVDWVTLSPKKGGELALDHVDEVKVVLPGAALGEQGWTDEELAGFKQGLTAAHWYVQPQDPVELMTIGDTFLHGKAPTSGGQFKYNVERCIDFVKRHPAWNLSLQGHKYINLP
jgi:7-carboxy-7-deazaguanine synthase